MPFIELWPEIHFWALPSFLAYVSGRPLGWSSTCGSRRIISGLLSGPACRTWVIPGGGDEELWGAMGGGGVSEEEGGGRAPPIQNPHPKPSPPSPPKPKRVGRFSIMCYLWQTDHVTRDLAMPPPKRQCGQRLSTLALDVLWRVLEGTVT